MEFNRTKPCKTCPFRTNENGLRHLRAGRAEEIADALMSGATFSCHDDLHLREHKRSHCVGAMLILEKENRPNQLMRIAERCRVYDRNSLKGSDEVFDNFEDWIDSQGD